MAARRALLSANSSNAFFSGFHRGCLASSCSFSFLAIKASPIPASRNADSHTYPSSGVLRASVQRQTGSWALVLLPSQWISRTTTDDGYVSLLCPAGWPESCLSLLYCSVLFYLNPPRDIGCTLPKKSPWESCPRFRRSRSTPPIGEAFLHPFGAVR